MLLPRHQKRSPVRHNLLPVIKVSDQPGLHSHEWLVPGRVIQQSVERFEHRPA
jgi:hypothetical protein